MKKLDLTGQKFGRLTVVKRATPKCGNTRWVCVCDCGGVSISYTQGLRSGLSQSCGCLCKERIREAQLTHGKTGTLAYKSWTEMRQRCTNPKSKIYKYYGERGISICDRWESFMNFFADMGERKKGESLERIDNNGNYEPSNCKWGTATEQTRNTSRNNIITHNGKTQCLSAWAEELNVNYKALWARLQNHPVEVAFTMKPRYQKRSSFMKSELESR